MKIRTKKEFKNLFDKTIQGNYIFRISQSFVINEEMVRTIPLNRLKEVAWNLWLETLRQRLNKELDALKID